MDICDRQGVTRRNGEKLGKGKGSIGEKKTKVEGKERGRDNN